MPQSVSQPASQLNELQKIQKIKKKTKNATTTKN